MKTALTAAAVLLLAAPSRAAGTTKPAAPTDPLHWDAQARAHAVQWYTVTIEGQKYLAYLPTKAEQSAAAYKAKDKRYVWQSPLFKIKVMPKDQKDPNTAQVMTEATALVLEGGHLMPKVVCTDPGKCQGIDVTKAGTPLLLRDDPSALPGFDSKSKTLKLAVHAPDAKVTAPGGGTDKTTDVDNSPALSAWEQAAFIEGSIGSPAKADSFKTNADKRAALRAAVTTYRSTLSQAPADALREQEIRFLCARFPGAASIVSGLKGPKADKTDVARWRALISQEVDGYLDSKTNPKPEAFAPATDPAKMLGAAQPPSSELEKALQKIYPEDTRMAGAKRAIIAKWLEAKKGNKDVDAAVARLTKANGADKAMFDDLWRKATGGGNLESVLKGSDPAGLNKLVDRGTLLDAYCQAGGSGAPSTGAKVGGSINQLKKEAGGDVAAAKGRNVENKGGSTLENRSAPAATGNDQLQSECSQRIGQVDAQIAALTPRANGLTDRTIVPPAPGGNSNVNDNGPSKFKPESKYGSNTGPQDTPKDANMGDHVRTGFVVGTFLGMIGLFAGGPIGLLVLGGAGFALGFGIDSLTNKAKK